MQAQSRLIYQSRYRYRKRSNNSNTEKRDTGFQVRMAFSHDSPTQSEIIKTFLL